MYPIFVKLQLLVFYSVLYAFCWTNCGQNIVLAINDSKWHKHKFIIAYSVVEQQLVESYQTL